MPDLMAELEAEPVECLEGHSGVRIALAKVVAQRSVEADEPNLLAVGGELLARSTAIIVLPEPAQPRIARRGALARLVRGLA